MVHCCQAKLTTPGVWCASSVPNVDIANAYGVEIPGWSLRISYPELDSEKRTSVNTARKDSKGLVTLRQISKNLRRFLGRLGYLPPGGKFGLRSGLRKSLPKGHFSAEDYNLQIILSPALRRCFLEVYVFFFFFLMKWTDELGAVLEVMFQVPSLRGAD